MITTQRGLRDELEGHPDRGPDAAAADLAAVSLTPSGDPAHRDHAPARSLVAAGPAPAAAGPPPASPMPGGDRRPARFRGGRGALAVRRGYQASRPLPRPAEAAALERPIDGSGRSPVKLSGRACRGWGWVEVRGAGARSRSPPGRCAQGEPLEGAVDRQEREMRRSRAAGHRCPRAPAPPGRWAAARWSRPATWWPPGDGRRIDGEGDGAGGRAQRDPVRPRRLLRRGRTCAVLPSGKHVEGDLVDGQLVVEAP